jgi:hypothetical protein
MLTKIADDFYIDLSKITYLAVFKNENKCTFILGGETFNGSAETGELIRHKLDWWLGVKNG